MSSPDVLTDTHLLLLCRDYLIDLRRNNDETVLTEKNLDPDYISLAIFSLNQSILRPDYLTDGRKRDDIFSSFSKTSGSHRIPNISKINKEILSPRGDIPRPYDKNYNDLHSSNLYRFYRQNGLGSAPENGPLELHELVTAGMQQLSARCRLEAEKDIIKSPQFEHYIERVAEKGYFRDTENSGRRKDPREEEKRRARKVQVYKEKYRKAIAKYRKNLAIEVEGEEAMGFLSMPGSLGDATSVKSKWSHHRQKLHSPPRHFQANSKKESLMSPLTPDTAGGSRKYVSKRIISLAPKTPDIPSKPAQARTSFDSSSSSQKSQTEPEIKSAQTGISSTDSGIAPISSGRSFLDGINRNRRRSKIMRNATPRANPSQTENTPQNSRFGTCDSVGKVEGQKKAASNNPSNASVRLPSQHKSTKASLHKTNAGSSFTSQNEPGSIQEVNAGAVTSVTGSRPNHQSEYKSRLEERTLERSQCFQSLSLVQLRATGGLKVKTTDSAAKECTSTVARMRSESKAQSSGVVVVVKADGGVNENAVPAESPHRFSFADKVAAFDRKLDLSTIKGEALLLLPQQSKVKPSRTALPKCFNSNNNSSKGVSRFFATVMTGQVENVTEPGIASPRQIIMTSPQQCEDNVANNAPRNSDFGPSLQRRAC